ncbi:MAG TPA: hypothetical protein VE338_05855 [Ktedonobacterales bacterium]|jgi:hypothetical protein|nr:hypothetical protein [Ktedonobacterales bacterium]
MRGGEGIQFRPTIVLCIGAEGQAVGDWLTSLLPSLDVPLREGVALLRADGPSADGEPLLAWWLGDETTDNEADSSSYDSTGGDAPAAMALPTRIIEALRGRRAADGSALRRRGVLDDAVISRIKEAGYAVPRGMVALWIVAAADSPLLADVVAAAQTALSSDGVEGWTLLALTNTYPLDPAEHQLQAERCGAQPWQSLLVGGETSAPPVTFAYLFETHDERGLFWEGPDETSFAAAEAIFTLTATGLTATHEYDETLRRNMPRLVTAAQERMSSIATSRLTFPRAQAERYCAYQLGATILREWTPQEAARLSRDEEQTQATAARAELRRIMDETASSNALVAALRMRAQRRSRRRERESELPPDRSDSKLVLRWLSPAIVRPLLTPQLDLPSALEGQRQLAEDGFTHWEEALVPAWSRYADETATGIAAHADTLALEGGALGVERAYAYLYAFNEALCDEQDQLDARQSRRIAQRTRFLSDLEAASEGPWLDGLPADGAGVSGDADDAREARVAARLGARWRWIHARTPLRATLIAAVTLAAATLALLALMIAPATWQNATVGWLALLATPLLVAWLAAWGYARHRGNVEATAATDLHQHYRAIYRNRIEKREAEWRETVLAMLRMRAERILDRLANWERFIEEMASALSGDAEAEEARLFDGAFGRRDVLVANRRRLRRDGYGLRDFELDVTKRRQAQPQPETPWHGSNRELLARLRDALRGRVSLVEAPASAIVAPVREYCLGVVRPYLTGDLVNLTEALETLAASEGVSLLEAMLERATLLYHPADQPRAATAFVAAREPDLVTLLRGKRLTGLIPVIMREREWLAVTRLLPGGARPDFLRDRAETTQAPIEMAPTWTQRLDVYQHDVNSQNGGVLN